MHAKHRMVVRVLLSLPICFAGMLLIWYGIPSLLDLKKVEPLPEPRREVPDSENIHTGLVEVAALHGALDPPEMARHPAALAENEEWLAASDAMAADLRRAIARPEFAWPAWVPPDIPLEDAKYFRAAARGLVVHAYYRLDEGQTELAIEDLRAGLRLGYEATEASCQAIDQLLGIAIEGIVMAGIQEALGSPPAADDDPTVRWPTEPWSAAEFAAWRALLDQLLTAPDMGIVLNQVAAGESRFFGGFMTYLQTSARRGIWRGSPLALGTIAPNPLFLPHRTQRQLREQAEELQRLAALPRWERDLPPEKRRSLRLDNLLGRKLGTDLMPGPEGLLNKCDEAVGRRRSTAASVAIKIFHETHGRLPKTLDELVDEGILDEVPVDPFDGRPLRYRPRDGIVYTVGTDETDNQGRDGYEDGTDRVAYLRFVARPPEK